MGGEYDHEVPRSILRDGLQNARDFEFSRLRPNPNRRENDHRECEKIWDA